METTTSSITIQQVSKSYGPVHALRDVSFEIRASEIHAVVGENGAGKSTLMGVLAGFVVPDKGRVLLLNGNPLPFGKPFRIKELGIAMVHQHFTLVPEFTVAENLALAKLPTLLTSVDSAKMAAHDLEVAKELDWEIDPDARVCDLPVGVQQRVEILKALGSDAQIIILDEPTAVLSEGEIDELFLVLRKLAKAGKTIILIAHKLREVLDVADRVTVLRKGEWIATQEVAETDEQQLAELMVGEVPSPLAKDAGQPKPAAFQVSGLSVKGDRGETRVDNVSFSVARGEIFGIGGVDGNGQVELAETLVGIRQSFSGCWEWLDSPSFRVGYIPQDRQRDGLALTMSVLDNLLITGHRNPALERGPFLNQSAARTWSKKIIDRFNIAVSDASDPVGALSGGNQQKVVVGRTLESAPALLVAVNPTRGLDVRAADFVHRQILQAREAGAAIVLFSTDRDELTLLSDRMMFMSAGTLQSQFL